MNAHNIWALLKWCKTRIIDYSYSNHPSSMGSESIETTKQLENCSFTVYKVQNHGVNSSRRGAAI